MERSEPSLVPEWLKGAGGGGGAAHHSQPPVHPDESGNSFLSRQRSQPSAAVNHGDYDSPRYNAAGSDRAFYPTGRRGGASNNSTGASERLFDRGDSYPRAYNSFGRSSGYRGGYEGTLDREREGPRDRERDWDWERDRERDFRDRERDRALGFGGGDDRDRDRDRPDAPGNFRRSSSGAGLRYESEVPLRRSQSIGGTGRALENGDKKATADVGSALPTAPPVNIGTLTSSMQKAAFERNFPSLGAQEKQTGVVQSSLGNVSVLSPRPSWQSSSPRPEGVRSATSGGAGMPSAGSASVSVAASVNVGGNAIGGDGWTSALADVPSSLTGLPSTTNGVVSGPTSAPTATSGGSASASVAAPSLIVAKMSEALAYPPRVRTPPQSSLESQRADESAAKQARQLILMKPTLPKNMGSRDITKPKVIRAVDVVAPQPIKLSQPLASQLVSSPYRPPAPPRPEPLKAPQGKLLVRKTSKEAVGAMVSPSSILKGDGAGSTSVVSAAGALVGMGGTNAGINASGALAPPRKQKQLLDRRAVPIPPISVPMGEGGSGPRSKESGSASDDKRPPVPAQNRSDFFNALRKKAAGISGGSVEKMESGVLQKNDGVNEKGVEAEEEIGPFSGDLSQMTPYQVKENGTAASTCPTGGLSNSDVYGTSETKENAPYNGASTEGAAGNSEQSSTAPSSPVATTNRATATEEEEAAFLRSLGWEESAEESGEGLTEEEINSFYQERLRSMSISPSLPNARNHRLRDVRVDLHVGSIGSNSSGMSSSDSESDDDLRVHRRS